MGRGGPDRRGPPRGTRRRGGAAPRAGCRRPLLVAVAVACAGGGLGFWAWRASPPAGRLHDPPALDLRGVDPAAGEAIGAASDRVRREPDPAASWGRLGMVLLAHDFFLPAAACLEQAGL